jgi:hypothetical protein
MTRQSFVGLVFDSFDYFPYPDYKFYIIESTCQLGFEAHESL